MTKARPYYKIVVDKPHRELYTRRNEGRVCCFWCCHPFDQSPVGLPVKHVERKERFHLQGVYCSWSCVNAENRNRADLHMVRRSGMIHDLAWRWHGVNANRTAPPRLALKMFGGTMTIDEFRNPPEKDYVLQTPPVLHVIPDEQLVLARAFGPASKMRPTQSRPPLSDLGEGHGGKEGVMTTAAQYHVNKVTVAERRKRKRATDLRKMGINIKQ